MFYIPFVAHFASNIIQNELTNGYTRANYNNRSIV